MAVKYFNKQTQKWEIFPGTAGISAYEAAQEEGYKGTEEEFNAQIANFETILRKEVEITNSADDVHYPSSKAVKNYVDSNIKSVEVVDNLTTENASKALSANQGKILNDTKLDKITYDTDKSTFAIKSGIPDVSSLASKTELTESLSEKANMVHTHVIADVTDLQTKLTSIDTELDTKVTQEELTSSLANKADKTEIPNVSSFATKSELNNKEDKFLIVYRTKEAGEFANINKSVFNTIPTNASITVRYCEPDNDYSTIATCYNYMNYIFLAYSYGETYSIYQYVPSTGLCINYDSPQTFKFTEFMNKYPTIYHTAVENESSQLNKSVFSTIEDGFAIPVMYNEVMLSIASRNGNNVTISYIKDNSLYSFIYSYTTGVYTTNSVYDIKKASLYNATTSTLTTEEKNTARAALGLSDVILSTKGSFTTAASTISLEIPEANIKVSLVKNADANPSFILASISGTEQVDYRRWGIWGASEIESTNNSGNNISLTTTGVTVDAEVYMNSDESGILTVRRISTGNIYEIRSMISESGARVALWCVKVL